MVDTLRHCWEVVESMAGSLNKGSEAAGETRRQNNFFKRQKKKILFSGFYQEFCHSNRKLINIREKQNKTTPKSYANGWN